MSTSKKCYATHLNDCDEKMSGEHYISESVLKLGGNAVRVSGFPWQKPNTHSDIGIGSLKSQMLCTHHNKMLSPLDAEGSRFVKGLKETFNDLSGRQELSEATININAELLELWFLKVFIGCLIVSGLKDIPKIWIDYLFQKTKLPDDSGLYFPMKNESPKWEFNLIKMDSIDNLNGHIAGAKFIIGGLPMLLTFGHPVSSKLNFNYLHRPSGIVFGVNDKKKGFQFNWGKYIPSQWVLLNLEAVPNE
jgi:hypothetical protein